MRGTTRNFMLGITTLAAAAGLVTLLMFFGELEGLFKPRYMLTLNATNAAGLREGSTIELHGVPVGLVDRIRARQDPQYPVQIVTLIDSSQRIPADVVPYATHPLLGGSATLQLEAPPPETGSPQRFLATDGSAEINQEIRSRLIEQITAELDSRMAPLLGALEDFERLSDRYITLADNLNELVQPPDPDHPDEARPNLRTAVEKLNTVLDDVREALELAKRWLGDEQLRADAKEAVGKANLLIDRAADTLEDYTKLAAKLEADADDVRKGLMPVLDDLAATLEEVRHLARIAAQGEGTIGQLLNNPDLYQSLTDAATRLERVLIEVQLLVEKVKAEGLTIGR